MNDKQEPVAWHFKCNDYKSVTLLKEHADAMVKPYGATPVPLYYALTLTDEERAAIAHAASAYADYYDDPELMEISATLRNLLERTK